MPTPFFIFTSMRRGALCMLNSSSFKRSYSYSCWVGHQVRHYPRRESKFPDCTPGSALRDRSRTFTSSPLCISAIAHAYVLHGITFVWYHKSDFQHELTKNIPKIVCSNELGVRKGEPAVYGTRKGCVPVSGIPLINSLCVAIEDAPSIQLSHMDKQTSF